MRPRANRAELHEVFGQILASEFPFKTRLADGEGEPDLSFAAAEGTLEAADWRRLKPIYRSALRSPEGRSVLDLYATGGRQILRCGGIVDFYLESSTIGYDLLDREHAYLVELRLLGPVLAYWLECRGQLALHAAAVATDDGAVAFLSGNRGGKTTLAASLMRCGQAMVSDDVLPVVEREESFMASPAYPQMRMWPVTAAEFLVHRPELERVHPGHDKGRVPVGNGGFGEFHPDALPLTCVYLPCRAGPGEPGAGIDIEPLSPAEAVLELVRGSFVPRLVEAAGLQPRRFECLARVAERVPVRRLRYPSGFERLGEVSEAILRDLASS